MEWHYSNGSKSGHVLGLQWLRWGWQLFRVETVASASELGSARNHAASRWEFSPNSNERAHGRVVFWAHVLGRSYSSIIIFQGARAAGQNEEIQLRVRQSWTDRWTDRFLKACDGGCHSWCQGYGQYGHPLLF